MLRKSIIIIVTVVVTSFILIVCANLYLSNEIDDGFMSDGDFGDMSSYGENDSCNVIAFSLNGYVLTYTPLAPEEYNDVITSSDDLAYGISSVETDPDIKGVIIAIDSGGGSAVGGEEIANALKNLQKPNVAYIRETGASAAYWAATGADKIYASKLSDVGGIGVTMSYLDDSKKLQEEGSKYIELSSAKFKDLGDTGRPLTTEERVIVMGDLLKAHKVFVSTVAENRKLDIKKVEAFSNGLTYMGEDALKMGLIDEIGDINSATKYIEEQIGEKAEVCWF